MKTKRIARKTIDRLQAIYDACVDNDYVISYKELQELTSLNYKKIKDSMASYKHSNYISLEKVAKGVIRITFNPEFASKYLKERAPIEVIPAEPDTSSDVAKVLDKN